jgi:hypothetical protein
MDVEARCLQLTIITKTLCTTSQSAREAAWEHVALRVERSSNHTAKPDKRRDALVVKTTSSLKGGVINERKA